MQKESKTKSIYKKQQIIIILVLTLCFITLASAFGRYVLNGINNFFVRTREFYFYSDKLKENSPIYQIDNWTGIDPYTITVNMNSMENNLKKATYDIQRHSFCSLQILTSLIACLHVLFIFPAVLFLH